MIGNEIGLRNVVEDLIPQLGGNLDVNGKEIVSVSDGDIIINTDGTGNIIFGDSTNNTTIEPDGTIVFDGTGGLIFGAMFIPGIDIVVSIGDANPTELLEVGTSGGWAEGELNQVTFTDHYLTVPRSGFYEINYDISCHVATGGATEIHTGVMFDGTAQRNNGEAHESVLNVNDDVNLSSNCILDCPNGTEEVSLWGLVDSSNDLHVDHGTMNIKLIAGA